MRTKKPWLTLLALLAALSLIAAACGDDEEDTSSSDTTEEPAEEGSDTTVAEGDMAEPVGEACSAIPADGEGSSAGMADDPTATAASNNPILSTLVDAVTAAELGDALNDPEAEYTVFAPSNDAFAKIDEATLTGMLEPEMKDTLTDVLTYHVYDGGKLDIDGLVSEGELTMLNGGTVEIAEDGETAMINGESVVICGNVTTANATVHIIDTVLMPPA
jgi:uncharacterized surface protein with fasciclin (FAS1) repeats